jgi:hypothetical protein
MWCLSRLLSFALYLALPSGNRSVRARFARTSLRVVAYSARSVSCRLMNIDVSCPFAVDVRELFDLLLSIDAAGIDDHCADGLYCRNHKSACSTKQRDD